jgi:colanic acid biosynthesis protein WcaH
MSDGAVIGEEEFTASVSHLPLVSIDLLVRNSDGAILLGNRENRPAMDHWFVPGGRIRRMERFETAFRRVANDELGLAIEIEDAEFQGVFQHMYDDSAFSDEIGSHYVSIAMVLENCDLDLAKLPQIQHKEYRWFNLQEIIEDARVHERTKEFFVGDFGIKPQ